MANGGISYKRKFVLAKENKYDLSGSFRRWCLVTIQKYFRAKNRASNFVLYNMPALGATSLKLSDR